MRISITEYENGGGDHIAGTIAEADDLGIFANENLFAASFWPPYGTYTYTLAGFRAFRDFDGNGSNFGDTSLSATSSNRCERRRLRQHGQRDARPARFSSPSIAPLAHKSSRSTAPRSPAPRTSTK